MKHFLIFTVASVALAQPTAVREDGRITVTGAEFASVQPETDPVVGIPLIPGIAWEVDGQIVFDIRQILQTHQVIMYSEPDEDGVRTLETVDLPPVREDYIDEVVRIRLEAENALQAAEAARDAAHEAMLGMMAGTDPNIEGTVSYFELMESIGRVGPQ